MSNRKTIPARRKARFLASAALLTVGLPHVAQAQDALVLDTITVEAGQSEIKSATGTSVGSEALKLEGANNITDTLRTLPGTFTRSPSDNPGLSINIRGMQGSGRVNTMIEGVPQTFRNLSGHAGSFDDQVFVDPSLLVGADISRGGVQGADGLGALSGSANLRLLDVDDVLLEGRTTGGMVQLSGGDNGSGYNGVIAGATRAERFSGLVALSGYEEGDYTDGNGKEVAIDSESKSGMLRFHLDATEDSHLSVLGLWGETDFLPNNSSGYYWETDKKLLKLDYSYNPTSKWVDLSVEAYLQEDDVLFPGSDEQSGSSFNGREGTDTGRGIKITNRSALAIGSNPLDLAYGVSYQANEFDGNAQSGANASGELEKYGAFLTGEYSFGAFDLQGGLRYDAYDVSGVTEATRAGRGDCPADATDGRCIDARDSRSEGYWLPSFELGYSPTEALRLYTSVAKTMRAPTSSEMFYPGGHNFSGGITGSTQNLDLRAETARTYEIGAQYEGLSVFTAGDSLTASATLFRSFIDEYILYGFDPDGNASGQYYNTPGYTRMQGVELELGYQTELYYVNANFTLAETEQPYPLYAGIGSDIGQLPDDFGSISAGVHLLGGDLTLGGRVRYVGESVIAIMDAENSLHLEPYTLVDLYGSYSVRNGMDLFFNVANVADRHYYDASTGIGDSEYLADNGGRGREVTIGATMKF